MAERTKIQKLILFTAAYFLVVSCANQLPPGGGPPDNIPPEVIEIIPQDQTVNYKETSIEITFSEYVNKRSVQESIFISPNIEGIIEYNWSGKTLEVELPDSLRENTTYTVTIGTDVTDINNNNKMDEAFTFAFSTGDKIDKGIIQGRIFDAKPIGVMIYAYRNPSDTLNPAKQKPDYVTQSGERGLFKLSGLGNGSYKVFAVRDEFKDFLYDPTQDSYGVSYRKITLDKNDSLFTGLNFQLQIEDTSKPRVFGLTMTDQYHLLVEFSEGIDSTKVTADNFFVYDSVNSKRTSVKYFFKGKTKKKNYLLALDDTLQQSEQLYLISQNIPDNSGNLVEYESTSFVRNEEPDTLAPALIDLETYYPSNQVDFLNGKLRMSYTDAFDQDDLSEIFIVTDVKGEKIIPSFNKIDDATIDLNFEQLNSDSDYEIKVDNNKLIDVAGNKTDSIFTHQFSTINKLDFSGLSGIVVAPDSLNIVVKIANLNIEELQYKSQGKEFNFVRVYPGEYSLLAFDDKNKNGEYDKGSIYPYKSAERFVFYPDTLELKPRWPVGDVKLNFE